MKPELTQERLKELLHYDPETGHFTRLVAAGNRALAGARAGTTDSYGYRRIMIDWVKHKAHRLAFLYMTGGFPTAEVDHINRDPSDNRWANLRPASRRENLRNRGLQRNNTSGYRGVSWHREGKKWQVRGSCGGGQTIHLGLFASLEEAAAVAQKWREENFGEFAT